MDTRCADPELQLDVDLMVLEYTLFQAVEVHLGVLSGGFEDDDGKMHGLQRVLAIFDSFIEIFNQSHPSHEQSPEFSFRLQILEFVVLLLCRCSSVIATDRPADDLSSMLGGYAKRDLRARRTWLASRERDCRKVGKMPATSWDLEQQIYTAWTGKSPNYASSASGHITGPLLLSLLPRFMAISARFMEATKQGPSDIWMDVACEFMLQASLEALQLRSQDGDAEGLPRLEDCFAWGYIDLDLDTSLHDDVHPAPYDDETAEIVNNLFRSPLEGGGPDAEHPDWTNLRIDTLHEFSIAADIVSSSAPPSSSQTRLLRLERLSHKHPFGEFQQRLVSLLQNLWTLSCRDEILGKPVLVEIGEGHVSSLGLERGSVDFEQFAARVGVDRGFLDEIEGDRILVRKAPDSIGTTLGLVREQSLNETYEHQRERERLRQARRTLNGGSPDVK
ncbi:uncharacterized protein A1O5_03029 [Cladophialophora psammophila CBS 110553]|uniref:Uncharacterized protein n=1 Tax=Cladophialophora psammophila CBS 110553 TaxID=1182543 RepID=W9XSJ5_9EURO|nr:uncharacterized protein A1O5_03029 [Cladophialophora psammophila CBS 110553]EXJ73269.1 hypothetical protein A1O5_03029 [Cladophialophora psammophila CBS 110553]